MRFKVVRLQVNISLSYFCINNNSVLMITFYDFNDGQRVPITRCRSPRSKSPLSLAASNNPDAHGATIPLFHSSINKNRHPQGPRQPLIVREPKGFAKPYTIRDHDETTSESINRDTPTTRIIITAPSSGLNPVINSNISTSITTPFVSVNQRRPLHQASRSSLSLYRRLSLLKGGRTFTKNDMPLVSYEISHVCNLHMSLVPIYLFLSACCVFRWSSPSIHCFYCLCTIKPIKPYLLPPRGKRYDGVTCSC